MDNINYNDKTKMLLDKYKLFTNDYKLDLKNNTNYYSIALNIKENLLRLFKDMNYDKNKFSIVIKKYKLDPNETIDIIIRYTINQKNNCDWDINKIKEIFSKVTDKRIETIQELLDKLLNVNDDMEIYNLIDSSIQNHIYKGKSNHLYNYSYLIDKDNYKEIYYKLQNKINIYKRIKDEKRNEKLLEEMQKIKDKNLKRAWNKINDYIVSDIQNIDDFCKNTKTNIKTFYYYLDIIKDIDTDLYNKYLDKYNIVKQRNFILLLNTGRKIIEYLKNGIEENGIIREFDLLDYYMLTKTSKTNLLKILNEYEKNDVYLFKKFIYRYHSRLLNSNDIHNIYNTRDYIGIEFDNYNNPIPNTGYLVTKEDKAFVFNYLKKFNIPISDDTYNIALKRYLNGNLTIENDEKTLTRDK